MDTDPPDGFLTETKFVLLPIPFSVRIYSLPDLFAGKLHAIICRKWKTRVKGRDWYDLVWYTGHYPTVRLGHLESRMRQTGNYQADGALTQRELSKRLSETIATLDSEQARSEVAPFVRDRESLELWSRDFFTQIIARIICI